jgi:Rps23 Pro-64 3,4-dihydroxylase Tpa1-like proline 4-hydroxylase
VPQNSAPISVVESSAPALFFDRKELSARARDLHTSYQEAAPFPHIVVDNFLPEAVLDSVLEEFPGPSSSVWEKYNDALQQKLGSRDEAALGSSTRALLREFNGSAFVAFLEELTGISGLIPDPWFEGGGLHQIEPGGLLKVHVDFNKHTLTRLDRRVNALLYLNKDWREEWAGHLELWNQDMTRAEGKILPIFNRLVVFNTTDFANHGHPEPLRCPEGRTRKSIALYYYSNGRPAHELKSSAHTTVFRRRPGERIPWTLSEIGENLLPPIVTEVVRKKGFFKGRR